MVQTIDVLVCVYTTCMLMVESGTSCPREFTSRQKERGIIKQLNFFLQS